LPVTTADRIKLLARVIEITEKVSKYLPIIVFAYAGLTLVFAYKSMIEHNIVAGLVLCVFAGFGLYLVIRISLTRRRWRREWQKYGNQ
jgi:Na+/H+ antiporter NhaA